MHTLEEGLRLDSLGGGRYARDVEEDGPFWGMRAPHGGYIMALALRALQAEEEDPTRGVRSLSIQFLSRVRAGRVSIDVDVVRRGRTVSSWVARLHDEDSDSPAVVCSALFTKEREGPRFCDEAMPEVPAPTEPDRDLLGFQTKVHERFDFHRRFGRGGRELPVEDGGWIVPGERGAWDHALALVASDVWCPPIIRHPDRMVATPTLQHTVHFGPDVTGANGEDFLVRHTLSSGSLGTTDEDIALWSSDGRLLLRARQLRMVVAFDGT